MPPENGARVISRCSRSLRGRSRIRAASTARSAQFHLGRGWVRRSTATSCRRVAALGRHSTRVAAELGDGWIPALLARDRLASWADQFNRLREAVAPQRTTLTVAAGPSPPSTKNPDAARDIAAACTAWYLSAMGGVYARSCPARATPHRSARSWPLTRAQARVAEPSHPPPNPYSTNSPRTEPATRSARPEQITNRGFWPRLDTAVSRW